MTYCCSETHSGKPIKQTFLHVKYGDRVGVTDAMRRLWKAEGKWKGEI